MQRLILALAIAGCGHSPNTTIDGATSGDSQSDGAQASDAAVVDGLMVPTCPSGTWCQETAPVVGTPLLASVWAVNVGDVFAVGDAGTILRRHAGVWERMTSNVTENLRGVWASSSSNAWAVGSAGTIVHFDGVAWTATTGATQSDLAAVWGSATNDVWAVGPGAALHYNGSTWTSPTMPVPGGTLLSVSGTGPNDVWICGESAYVRRYTGGTTWSAPISVLTNTSTYYAIAAVGTGVWVGAAGDSARLETGTWIEHATATTTFQGFYGASPTDVWAIGGKKVGHWAGSAWDVSQPAQVTASLYGVSGAGTDVFVVGAGAMILHRD